LFCLLVLATPSENAETGFENVQRNGREVEIILNAIGYTPIYITQVSEQIQSAEISL
jgi:hypothetical protein